MVGGEPMQLQSSYIFLPNPYNKKPAHWQDDKGVLHVETGLSIYSHIMKGFPNAKNENIDDNIFQNKYSVSVEIDKETVKISVISKNVGESYYVNVMADGKSKTQIVGALELFQNKLYETGIEEDYIAIISYDAVSEYYCNKLYPKLNALERNLRKLLFCIYVLNFGREYFQTTTTKEMQDKAKSRIRAKGGNEKKETQYVKQFFYSLEYSDIQQLLFSPRWTRIDEDNKRLFLDEHDDLSKLSDEELRNAINDISPKSDWERFFNEKFEGVDVESGIEAVRPIRNSVAHCKFLGKEDYSVCNRIINTLNRALYKAISIAEEEDFSNKNIEYLRDALSGVSNRIHEMTEKLKETFLFSSSKSLSIICDAASTLALKSLESSFEASPRATDMQK